ncbi:recombinase family protein [Iningainema tapete]|uniref:Recombinase family protein n=1 Tax=Iningainema tapete BLCC-T55 TaxID=2748662 RepID=A0A8J6XRW5_9CYAN|nr:recombinase family protein [Iningainema tapete]MBD2777280.1 recombinase family protein [Iningainema tapete BLCC-T55]
MKIVAYSYTNPLLEPAFDITTWVWDVDRFYQDLGDRSQLTQLLHDCQTEPFDYLLIPSFAELGDTLETVNDTLAQLEKMGVSVIAVASDSSTIRADLLKLAHEIHQQHRSQLIRAGHARNRLETLPPPGRAPYGYRKSEYKYIIDRSTSTIVKDFFEKFLLYGSLRGAVRYIAKKYGKKISVTTGRRWLTNPVYRGDTAYHNGEIISNTHAAIVSRSEAAQIDRLLRRNSHLSPRTKSAPRSLAGLVVCGECQSHMTITRVTIRNKDKEYLYLRPISCPKCPKCRAISYQEVLENTIEVICRDLPLAVASMNFPQLDELKNSLCQSIARQEQILEQLPGLIESGVLDTQTAKLRAYKLRTEISALLAQLATLPPVNLRSVAQAVSIPQFWLDLSESERRFYFREFIRQIEIIRPHQELRVIFIF